MCVWEFSLVFGVFFNKEIFDHICLSTQLYLIGHKRHVNQLKRKEQSNCCQGLLIVFLRSLLFKSSHALKEMRTSS